MENPQVIAYYLPQYHPTPENDLWWGKGFTEWTNVAKAHSLYIKHDQPKIPADLGFYDLRLPQVREQQAELAQRAGISAFCYWHYWFGKDDKLLNTPFEEVVRLGEPDFPFCLAWANHSWYNKSWKHSNGIADLSKSKLLKEQRYEGVEDYTAHFYDLLPAFKDRRYFRVHDKLLFVIFNPFEFDDFEQFKQTWNRLAIKENLPGFFWVAHVFFPKHIKLLSTIQGFDGINLSLHHIPFEQCLKNRWLQTQLKRIQNHFRLMPQVVSYKKAITQMDSRLFEQNNIYPTLVPNWDHTPRSGRFGRVFQNCTPELFGEHISQLLKRITNKPIEDQILFLKSWNEWGEGNYMEPDLKHGTALIDTLAQELRKIRL